MPSKKTSPKEIHGKKGKKQKKRRFPSFDGVLAESQYRLLGALRNPNRTLASHLDEAIRRFNDISQLSVYRLRENGDEVQLEHHFTLMKFGDTVKILSGGEHIRDPHHRTMMAIDQERVRHFAFDKGIEWSFNLQVGEIEPKMFKFEKVPGKGSEICVPIVREDKDRKTTIGMLVINGADLALTGSKNKTGKRAVIESAMHSANIMSIISHILSTKIDGLTGLPTKQDFRRDLEEATGNLQSNGTTFSLIMLDIDHFKYVNDTYGHLVGDEVLASFSKIIQESVRDVVRSGEGSPDVVYRWGGEEFFVILKNVKREDALKVAERIRIKTQETTTQTKEGPVKVTCSTGVVSADDVKERTAESLESLSDFAMLTAKRRGRNRVYWTKQTETGFDYTEYKPEEK